MSDKNNRLPDEVLEEFLELFEKTQERQFDIGDKLIEVVKSSGGRKKEVLYALAGNLRIATSTLYDYYRIAQRWTPEYRAKYQGLQWTIVRNSDPNIDEDLLDKAVDNGWNATEYNKNKYPKRPLNTEKYLGSVIATLKLNTKNMTDDQKLYVKYAISYLESAQELESEKE